MPYKPLSRELESLFNLSQISLDPTADDFRMRRFFPVIVWVQAADRNETLEIFDRVMVAVTSQLAANGFAQVEGMAWGPFDGSRFGGIFGQSNGEPKGPEFRQRLKRFLDAIETIVGPTKKGTKVLIIVGAAAVAIAGGPAAAAIAFNVPVLVTYGIAAAGTLVSSSSALKKVFEKRDDPLERLDPPAEPGKRQIDFKDEDEGPSRPQPTPAGAKPSPMEEKAEKDIEALKIIKKKHRAVMRPRKR